MNKFFFLNKDITSVNSTMDEATSPYISYDQFQRLKMENMRLLSQLIKVSQNIDSFNCLIEIFTSSTNIRLYFVIHL